MGKIVYVMSENRSGSTLLDQILGAHSDIVSLGEVHQLVAYVLNDRTLYNPVHPLNCSCGERVSECGFWQESFRELGRDPRSLSLKLRFFDRVAENRKPQAFVERLCRRVLTRRPRVLLTSAGAMAFNTRKVAADSFDLYRAILRSTNAKYLVDSSKNVFRFRALYESYPDDILGIMLVRDYRGNVHSKLKRGRDLEQSTLTWVRQVQQMTELTSDIPSCRVIRVRYEDLCSDPRAELSRICNFLDVDFRAEMLRRPSDDTHHLGGSPSKLDPEKREIRLDTSYLNDFDDAELAMMSRIAGPVAREWGYD